MRRDELFFGQQLQFHPAFDWKCIDGKLVLPDAETQPDFCCSWTGGIPGFQGKRVQPRKWQFEFEISGQDRCCAVRRRECVPVVGDRPSRNLPCLDLSVKPQPTPWP